jgi:hypothetical protein
LKFVAFKALGYQVGYFETPSKEWEDELLLNLDTIVYHNESCEDVVYLPGRDINLEIEKEGKGYTRNLLGFLQHFCQNNALNLYYFHTVHNPASYTNNVDSLEFESLCMIVETSPIEVLIGMSHGAELAELVACSYGLKAISIGGSVRNLDASQYYTFDPELNKVKCLSSDNIYCVTGSRDGQYENNRLSFTNNFSYRGHHYITDEALTIIESLLNEITL